MVALGESAGGVLNVAVHAVTVTPSERCPEAGVFAQRVAVNHRGIDAPTGRGKVLRVIALKFGTGDVEGGGEVAACDRNPHAHHEGIGVEAFL